MIIDCQVHTVCVCVCAWCFCGGIEFEFWNLFLQEVFFCKNLEEFQQ